MADSPWRNARASLRQRAELVFPPATNQETRECRFVPAPRDLKFFADAIHHLRDGVFFLHEIPENQANLEFRV